ncbi:lipase secretion chaperone [Vibrio kanaloae]|uniref:lipase secretion chaperone n=1 Tax=Vibrio kanaloae TaxID=170673 RepID=UPI000988DF9C|nr:lipase secretion chaperone [Vibrio kanaloae]QPK05835.1 lipase chaperone [Vibrio kanaloae]
MTKTAIFSITTIALMSIAAVFLYVEKDDLKSNNNRGKEVSPLKIASQQDTDIDTASIKDMMEYFVSGNTKLTLEDIRTNVEKHYAQSQVAVVDEALFSKYIAYKSALASLDVGVNIVSVSVEDLRLLNQALLDLQAQFFTEGEISILFTHDNRMREIALKKLLLKQEGLQGEEYQQRLELYMLDQPDYVQSSFTNQRLLQQLSHSETMDQQDKYLLRSELVGEKAVLRLEALDKQRADFEGTLAMYLTERNKILDDSVLSALEQQERITQLRNTHFLPQEFRRVEAIERIRAAELSQ